MTARGSWSALLSTLFIGARFACAGTVTIPNTFTPGTVARAADMNANFTALANAVNGSAGDITSLQSSVAAAGFNYRGAWAAGIAYVRNDVVTEAGSSYVATKSSTALSPAADVANNGSNWGLIAQKGVAGPAGATGPQGPIGLPGSIGPAGPVGATGPQGPVGSIGPAGPAGPTGAQGPQGTSGLSGHYISVVVNGRSNPWDQVANPAYPYSSDAFPPVVRALASIGISAGQTVYVRCRDETGALTNGGGLPDTGCAGLGYPGTTHSPDNGLFQPICSNYYPSKYIDPSTYPVWAEQLIAVFTSQGGVIVGTPFVLTAKVQSQLVPAGAVNIQFGMNDCLNSDNSAAPIFVEVMY